MPGRRVGMPGRAALRDRDTRGRMPAMSERLTPAAVAAALGELPGWRRAGRVIRRTFEFPDFVGAMRFVNAVARAAERAGHHPDIDIRWNRVTLTLTTHDAGGLTARDTTLAARVQALAERR